MGSGRLTGNLDLLLLGVLSNKPAHGYGVIQALRERSNGSFDLPEGTIYPALHKLERAGLIASEWDDGPARRRRIYALTPKGHQSLHTERAEWNGFARSVNAVLGGLA